MKNHITRKALKALANAPTTAARDVINSLPDENDKQDAKRLFVALGVRLTDENDDENDDEKGGE